MNYSYDYEELIVELREEIKDGVLAPASAIQILRADKPVFENYRPIVDWYYEHDAQMEDFAEGIGEPGIAEAKAQYLKDRSRLKKIAVAECLWEMEHRDNISVK